jgi:hypothetical protein
LLLLAMCACSTVTIAEDKKVSQDVPELQVLSNFIGTWDVVATANEAPAAEGQQTTKWILDGRFVQTTGSVTTADGSNDFKLTALITYDQMTKTYRWWSFMSNGHTEESEGTWDAKTRTMTRITRYGDFTQTTKSNFAKPGIEKWTMINMDQNKKVVSEMRGTNTRRNE